MSNLILFDPMFINNDGIHYVLFNHKNLYTRVMSYKQC